MTRDNTLLSRRCRALGPAYRLFYDEPLHLVRGEGAGLFTGLDLVSDRGTRAPASELAKRVVNGMRECGVLVGLTGPGRNVIKIRPPLVIDESQLDLLSDVLAQTLVACMRR